MFAWIDCSWKPWRTAASRWAARHANERQLLVFRAVKSNDIRLMFTAWRITRPVGATIGCAIDYFLSMLAFTLPKIDGHGP